MDDPGKTGGLRQHTRGMTITGFDTHQTVKDLTAVGFTDAQAEALTQALRQVQNVDLSDLATKTDIAATRADLHQEIVDLRNEVKLEFANVRREMAELKAELIKWVLGIGFAQVAAIVALLKLLPGGASVAKLD
jgi:hypothetical protein